MIIPSVNIQEKFLVIVSYMVSRLFLQRKIYIYGSHFYFTCIRGHFHVCFMGDVGVENIQFLENMISVARRGFYTTFRGSSGVGMTTNI